MRTTLITILMIFTLFIFISPGEAKVTVKTITWNDWSGSVEINNGDCKLVVVPAIGRIMYYGLAEQDNVLWSNPKFYGKVMDQDNLHKIRNWTNLGGDKVWPTQQDDFETLNGFGWPPDPWFDAAAFETEMLDNGVRITGPVSDYCGARIIRTIKLADSGSRVTIDQRLEKIKKAANANAEPIDFTIWNITQVKAPEFILFDINPDTRFDNGFRAMMPGSDESVKLQDKTGIFYPHNRKGQKIGTDSQKWLAALVGNTVIAEFFKYDAEAIYPDKGCSAEVYTSPPYTELEPLSPLKKLEIGDSIGFTIAWQLYALPTGLASESDKVNAITDWANANVMK